MNIADFLQLVIEKLEENKITIGLSNVYDHSDYRKKFTAPAIFCEIDSEENTNDPDEERIYSVVGTLIVKVGNNLTAARQSLVEKGILIEAAFVDTVIYVSGVEYGFANIEGGDYIVAELKIKSNV